MIDLLIVADDFTGALDTGVQYASGGARTAVVTGADADLAGAAGEARVLVVDARTRHLSPSRAYETVYDLVSRAAALGIPHIYKKTDSALRGNVGAELTAAMRAAGSNALPFLPSYPAMGRVTRGGAHYVDGVPVARSVFGRDPSEPVAESDVVRLIHLQCDTPAASFPADATAEALAAARGILAIDAQSDADLMRAGRTLSRAGLLRVAAGCAGFAAAEQALLGLSDGAPRRLPRLERGLLVVCGSVNPITRRQLDAAEAAGFLRLRLTCRQKLTPGWFEGEEGRRLREDWRRRIAENPWCIIDANDAGDGGETTAWAAERGMTVDEIRVRVCGALGDILAGLFVGGEIGTPLITGGDTLLQCMARLGISRLEPLAELRPGVVLSGFMHNGVRRLVLSKSGGFGGESLLTDLKAQIEGNRSDLMTTAGTESDPKEGVL